MLGLSPLSRRRLASGATTIGALVVAGLGLTASGSGAAAISAGVKEAVAQVVPPASSEPPVPSASPAFPQTTSDKTASRVRTTKRVTVVKDGKTNTYDGVDAEAYVAAHPELPKTPGVYGPGDSSSMIFNMPNDPSTRIEVQLTPVRSANCGIGSGEPTSMVVNTGKGEKRMIVICTDRIRKATAEGMVTLSKSRETERTAYASALTGLIDARARIAGNNDMNDADRTRALTAIDTSITEMKAQIARFN